MLKGAKPEEKKSRKTLLWIVVGVLFGVLAMLIVSFFETGGPMV